LKVPQQEEKTMNSLTSALKMAAVTLTVAAGCASTQGLILRE